MPAAPGAAPERIREANVLYHDAAAIEYDSKWGIDFGEVGQNQVRQKVERMLGRMPALNGAAPAPRFERALEIGAGTGYFGLNLLQQGLFESLTASDISQGMLDRLADTAAGLELTVETVRTDAEQLPFEDESFDLVFGHAVLHHLPDLDRAAAELLRVLRPGGRLAFCGEPSRYGDALASVPKRSGLLLAPLWRQLLGATARREEPADCSHGHALESEVDVHAFAPSDLRGIFRAAGFEGVKVQGEELVANLYGWLLRSLEATAEPDEVPWAWRSFAFRSYLQLQRLDRALLEPRLPAELFYNLMLSAGRPA
jgi:SAM-dependent methyltransferase